MHRIATVVRRFPALVAGVVAASILGGVALALMLSGQADTTTAVATPTVRVSPSPTHSPTAEPTPEPTEMSSPTPSPSPSPRPTPAPQARCPLDGMPLAEGFEPNEPAMAVQIENHPVARPARNLGRADMVVETTVEGDTTRFTAIYLCDETDGMTGPVRSARYYNIDLWQDIRLLTVGFGRSNGAHARFVAAGMPYPDGMTGWPWYQRWGPRPAPHNLYVDLEAMREAVDTNAALGRMADRVDDLRPPFTFANDPELPADGRAVQQLRVATTPSWRFGWSWEAAEGAWMRSDAGVAITDEATGDRLGFTTLLVQRVTQETVHGDPDPGGNPRRLHHLVGRGEGTIYVQGRAFDVRWERPTAADRTRWTWAASGDPVVLPPGPIWWHILPMESRVTEG
ncbi:MAG: DUF3048 domain-containing protein [Chloroflexi bacterium]|nr:DUF3048 domain-containing protein [Chloroflexota bacterium]